MLLRYAASVRGGALLPVYSYIPSLISLERAEELPKANSEESPNPGGRTIVFEARAYISYNLKFVY